MDGDKLLVVADKKLIEVAERNMNDIVPLYYNMRKAEPVHLDNESIYNGLNAAFIGGNIGIYRNNISKIWNSDVFVSGSEKEKQDAVDIVKLLCMENNFVIDFAKTLYKPERPDYINEQITAFTNEKLPHFFKYAKDKGGDQVLNANQSFVNKLNKIIPNPRINCKKLGLGKIDHTLMMSNPDIECKVSFADNGRLIKEDTDPIIVKYCEFDREYYLSMDAAILNDDSQSNDKFMKKSLKYEQITNMIKSELSQFGRSDEEIADILVKFLYGIKNGKNKTALWMCYGDYIVENLERIFKPQTKVIQCIDCGEWFEVGAFDSRTERCDECYKEYRKKYKALKERERRERLRGQTL